jgi:hypothetical protein
VVSVEIFLGVLLGFLAGMLLAAKFLRQEIAANIGPRLDDLEQRFVHIERQLQILLAELHLDSVNRLTELDRRRRDDLPPD